MQKSDALEMVYLFSIQGISFVCLKGISGFCKNSGSAAGINALICTFAAILVFCFCREILAKKGLFSVIDGVFGKNIRTVIMTLFFFVTVLNAGARLKMYTDAVSTVVLRNTPSIVIAAVFCICAFFVCRFGTEALCRCSLIMFFLFAVIFAVIILFSFRETKITNIYPVLGKGSPANVANMLYVFSDGVYITLLARGRALKKSLVRACVTTGVIAFVLTAFYTLCVPWYVADKYEYPLYILASLANSSVIFQRLDGLVYMLWFFCGFTAVGALSLFATEIFAKNFSVSDRSALSAPVVLGVFLCAITAAVGEDAVSRIMTFITFAVLPLVCFLNKINFSFGKNTLITMLALGMVMFSGCSDSRETDALATVLAVSVDEAEQGREYTFSVADTSGNTKSESGDGAGTVILTSRGRDAFDAINILETKISRELSFSHLGALLFSEEAAAKEMYKDVMYFKSRAFVRPQTHIVIAGKNAGEYIKNLKIPLQPNTEKYFEGILNQKKHLSPMRISDFINGYEGKKSMFVPVIMPGNSGDGADKIVSGIVKNGEFLEIVKEEWFPPLMLEGGCTVYEGVFVRNQKAPLITTDITEDIKVQIELCVEAASELKTKKLEEDTEEILYRYAREGIDIADACTKAAKHYRLQKNYQSRNWEEIIKKAVFEVKIRKKGG